MNYLFRNSSCLAPYST